MVIPVDPGLAQALTHVECLPLGDTVIVHNRESGAMVETNAFGAMLLDHLTARPDPDTAVAGIAAALARPEAEVRDAVAPILARWTADGVFLTAQRPFPRAVPYRPVEGGVVRRFTLGPRAVTLACEDAALVTDLDRALAPLGLGDARPQTAQAPLRLEALHDGAGYGVFRDGAPVWGVAGYELTRFHLLREIMDGLVGPERVGAQLHASAVALSGQALVFAGASGSGKSTLATLLLGAGCAQVADDHVALSTGGDRLFAFPTRPNLKPGTKALPEVRAIVAAEGAEDAGGFAPRTRVPAGTPVALAALVFPAFAPDAENSRSPVAPEAALRMLIQTGSRVSRSTRSVAPLIAALDGRPIWRLSYRDSAFARDACLALMAG